MSHSHEPPALGGEKHAYLSGNEPTIGGASQRERFLFRTLRDFTPLGYYFIARALGERGNRAALDSLHASLQSSNPRQRSYALIALGWISEVEDLPPDFIPGLIRSLKDPSRMIREQCVQTLIKMGPSALADLHRALDHLDPHIRAQVALILGDIRDEGSVAILLDHLSDSHRLVREASARGLSRIGEQHKSALMGALDGMVFALENDPEPQVRAQSAIALGHSGRRIAVTHLIKALEDEHPQVRAVVIETLGRLGDVRSVPALIPHLYDLTAIDSGRRICHFTEEALSRISTEEALEALRQWRG